MIDVLRSLLGIATVVFAATSMLSVGFGYTLAEIAAPLRRGRRVLLALVANFVLVPILGWIVAWLMALDQSLAIGLMLLATGAGAPFLIKLTAAARGDLALSATVLVLLVPVTIVYMPLVVPLLIPGVAISAGAIAMPLVLSMLVPLALGLAVRARRPALAARLGTPARITSTVALLVLFACAILVNLEGILTIFGRGAIGASFLFVIGAFGIGYLLAAPRRDSRIVVGLGTGQRNVAAAMVVAAQTIGDPDMVLMVAITSLIGLLVLFPIAHWLRSGAVVEDEDIDREGAVAPAYGHDLASRWRWFLVLGIFLVAMGALSLSSMALAALATVPAFGLIVLLSAVAQLALALAARRWSGFSLHLLLGVLGAVIGGLCLARPALGAGALTFMIATWLLVSGAGQIAHALSDRYRQRAPSIAFGALSAILGLLLVIRSPLSTMWLLGLYIGLHLIAQGVLWIGFGASVRPRPE